MISCPGDVESEIDIINDVVKQFNSSFNDTLGIAIKTIFWSEDSFSESGDKPQTLINKQLVNDCDAAVAIFWTKFGTPTDHFSSGTEEEIMRMLDAGKQVFMYFSDKPVSPSKQISEDYKKIQTFRKKYKDKGIYFIYSSDEEFKKLLYAHITRYFLNVGKTNQLVKPCYSELKLLGINKEGKLSNEIEQQEFVFDTRTTMTNYYNDICSEIKAIANMDVGSSIKTNNSIYNSFVNPVAISIGEEKDIVKIAEQLKIKLADNFFELGSLHRNLFSANYPFNDGNLDGTKEEILKYRKINDLHETMLNAIKWFPIEMAFKGKKCIKFALCNKGRTFDEDVEITLRIPRKALLTFDEFPPLSENNISYLLGNCDMSVLFGIHSTAECLDYSASERGKTDYASKSSYVPILNNDYREDFIDELKDVFCYSVYSEQQEFIVELKIDYIKHNTNVAFPSVIFIKENIKQIPYRITSKRNPDIVEGILQVK